MLTGLLVILLLLVALLAIPVIFRFQLGWPQHQSVENDTRVEWAFGLVRIPVQVSKSEAATSADEEQKEEADGSKRSARKKRNLLAAVKQKPFRRRVFKFSRDIWRAVHKNDVSLRLRLGLGDPADTGQLWAMLGPIAGMLSNIREASINIEPDFLDYKLDLQGSGNIRVIPLQLIYLTAGVLLSPAVWSGIKEMKRV